MTPTSPGRSWRGCSTRCRQAATWPYPTAPTPTPSSTRPSRPTTRAPPARTTCVARTGSPASSPGSTSCRPAWSPRHGGGPTSGTSTKSPGKSTRSAGWDASPDAPPGRRSAEQAGPAGELQGEPLIGVFEVDVEQLSDAAEPVGHRVAVQVQPLGRPDHRPLLVQVGGECPD